MDTIVSSPLRTTSISLRFSFIFLGSAFARHRLFFVILSVRVVNPRTHARVPSRPRP